MKTLRVMMAVVAVCLTVIGCRYIGGGIAGASFDPIWYVRAAERYAGVVASNKVTVSVARLAGEQPPQLFDDIMHAFPIRQESIKDVFVSIAGTSFAGRYSKYRFELCSDNTVVISEKLPKVFNMHPVCLGIGTVGSQSVIMIVNKSRSSTGLYFVGLYTAQGETLYKSVLGAGQVWDIRPTDNGIDILGHSEIRHITMIRQSEQIVGGDWKPASQRRQAEAEIKELKAMNNKTGWQQVWRSEQSSISDKYEAVSALIVSNMTMRSVTNVLGQFSASVRYHGLAIAGKKAESFSQMGVSYKFPDGKINILFIPNGEQFDDWKFDQIRLHTNMEERATDPEPGK